MHSLRGSRLASAFGACCLLATFAPGDLRAQSSAPLSFRIEASRSTVRSGERIVMVLRLTSLAPTVANARMVVGPQGSSSQEVSFHVEDTQHRVLPFRLVVQSRPPRDEDFAEVTPAQSVERQYDLSRAFDLRATGTYTVRATYQSAAAGPAGRSAFTGSLSSNTVTITVTAP